MARLELRVLPAPNPAETLQSTSPGAQHEVAAPPCFFSQVCLRRAAMEKAGRSVCRGCARRLRGVEYPLRDPSIQPLYLTGRAACEALDMLEDLTQAAADLPLAGLTGVDARAGSGATGVLQD
jgi:hypothetical protein